MKRREDKARKIREIDKSIDSVISSLNEVLVDELTTAKKENPDLNDDEILKKVVNNLKDREDDNFLIETIAGLMDERNKIIGIKKEKTADEIVKNMTPSILSVLVTIFLFVTLGLLFTGEVHSGLRDILNIFIGSSLSIVGMSYSFWFGHKDKKEQSFNPDMNTPQK